MAASSIPVALFYSCRRLSEGKEVNLELTQQLCCCEKRQKSNKVKGKCPVKVSRSRLNLQQPAVI